MFQNMVLNGLVTPLCNTDETSGWENRPFCATRPQQLQKPKKSINKGEVTRAIRKKPKRNRTAYTTEQLKCLEEVFSRSRYIDQQSRKELSRQMNIADKCLKVWFQNRRMKEKRDSESSCDSSSESFAILSPKINNNVDGKDENIVDYKQISETQTNVTQAYEPNNFYTNCQPVDTTANFYHANPSEYQHQTSNYENYPQDYQFVSPNPVTSNTAFYYDNNEYPNQFYTITNQQQCAFETYANVNETQTNWVSELPDLMNYLG